MSRHGVLCVEVSALDHMQQFHYVNIFSTFYIESQLIKIGGSDWIYSAIEHKSSFNQKETVQKSIFLLPNPYSIKAENFSEARGEQTL